MFALSSGVLCCSIPEQLNRTAYILIMSNSTAVSDICLRSLAQTMASSNEVTLILVTVGNILNWALTQIRNHHTCPVTAPNLDSEPRRPSPSKFEGWSRVLGLPRLLTVLLLAVFGI